MQRNHQSLTRVSPVRQSLAASRCHSTIKVALTMGVVMLSACDGDRSPTEPTGLTVAGHRPSSSVVVGASWTSQQSMPTGISSSGAAVINGILYVVGGYTTSIVGMLQAYDPATNTWTTKAPMPTPRYQVAVAAVNGVLYAVGGDCGNGCHLATVEAYDPTTNTWTTKAPMPGDGVAGAGAASVNGLLYIIGGVPNNTAGTVYAYDPVGETWTVKSPMPTLRTGFGVAVANGKIYAVGGYNGNIIATVEEYDPSTNTWTSKAPMPTPRVYLAAAGANGIVWAVGGFTDTPREHALQTLEAYDPAVNKWKLKPLMPTARHSLAAAIMGDALYAAGGTVGLSVTTLESYGVADGGVEAQFITFTSTPPNPAFPGDTYNVSAVGGGSGNPVTFGSATQEICTVLGSTVTLLGEGDCTVMGFQAAGTGYLAAPLAVQNFTVSHSRAQSITFTSTPPNPALTGGTYTVSATGGASGNTVIFSSLTPATCTVSGTSVSLVAVGGCTVAADQAGGPDYDAAPQATQAFAISSSAQSITFTSSPPSPALTGGTYNVTATGGASGNAVTFSSLTVGVCTVSASTVSLIAIGNCTVAANQAAGNGYTAAAQATQTFTVSGSLTPLQQLQNAVVLVDQLLASGALNSGNANSMKAKLNSASSSVAAGNYNAALNQLNSLLNQLSALGNAGKLIGPEADALRALIADVIASISP